MKIEHFHDFDQFASAVRGVESKMLMRSPQQHLWTIQHVRVGNVEVQVGNLGSGNIAGGQLRADGFMIYVPLTPKMDYYGNGVRMDTDCFCILEPGTEFCVSTKRQHDWCSLFVPTDSLPEQLSDTFSRHCRVDASNRRLAHRIRDTVRNVILTAQTFPGFESTDAANLAAAEVTAIGSLAVGEANGEDSSTGGRPRVSRDDIIQRTMRFLETSGGRPVNVADLAAAADVSERTLRSTFHEFFGVGPSRYLRLRRMNLIHRALRVASPKDQTVAGILCDHGEWAFGRFAAEYRQMYGELPSATLRQNAVK